MSTRMIKVIPASDTEYDLAFATMRENMIAYHEKYELPWNQDWLDRNFRHKENYSVFSSTGWIGFLSLEWRNSDLFIHTLQLTRRAQGSVYGARVYEWMVEQMKLKGIEKITCKTFRGSSMLGLYKRMGFSEVAQEKYLVTLEMRPGEHKPLGRAYRSPRL